MEREVRLAAQEVIHKLDQEIITDNIAQGLRWFKASLGLPPEIGMIAQQMVCEGISECKLLGLDTKAVMHEAFIRVYPPKEEDEPVSRPL